MKKICSFSICLLIALFSIAQITNDTNTVGLLYTEPEKVSDGLTLFAPNKSKNTYLIDNCGNVVRKWVFETPSSYASAYLLPTGAVVRILAQDQPENANGCIELRSWEDELLWRYCSNEENGFDFHSDLQYLPNGNFLVLSINILSAQEALEAGVNPDVLFNTYYSESLIELKPLRTDDALVVWEWQMVDHLVQDFDSTKLNFGNVKENFRKIDANLRSYFHFNSVEYNVDLDQIALSNFSDDEIYIIDHSTSTEEAASSTGGKYGFGGDLLFRWGNPNNYGIESKQHLFDQHNPQWIPDHHTRFGGQLSLFNNRYGELNGTPGKSAIFILDIDPDKDGVYPLAEDGTFLPEMPHHIWTGQFKNTNIFSNRESGINVLPNGHLQICEAVGGRFTEVDTSGNIIWAYQCPDEGYNTITSQGDRANADVYKIKKYEYDYIPQLSRSLCGQNIIENENELSNLCKIANEPKVSFTTNVTNAVVEFFVETTNTDSLLWNFGDGNTSIENNPTHQFKEVGMYNVCVMVYNCYSADTLCQQIAIDQFTSINNNAANSLVQVYPVPAATHLYIKTFSSYAFSKYSIYNLNGKFIDDAPMVKNQINIKHLNNGIYFLQLNNSLNNEVLVYKFVKE